MEKFPSQLKCCGLMGCKSVAGDGYALFNCPSDGVTQEKWINFRKSVENFDKLKQPKYFKLCEAHFSPSDIVPYGKSKRLKNGSVPKYKYYQVI